MTYSIVGGGLAGCVLASLLPNSTIYEKNKIGGLCADNENYQEFVHILHTDNKEVWDFVNKHTQVKPHKAILKSYINGELKPYPPKVLDADVFSSQYAGYSKKMWKQPIPKEALARIITSPDGFIFHDKYQGVPYFTTLFKNLIDGVEVVSKGVKHGDLRDNIILTGAIDEYFDYCYGKLPYRGMQSVHYKSEIGLDADFITFSDERIPFQRIVDYKRLGYNDYIGIEISCDADHYPIRTKESDILYSKYEKLAKDNNVLLAGRLATYHYMDMDEVIEQCFELAGSL